MRAGLVARALLGLPAGVEERSFPSGWLADQLQSMRYNGSTYILGQSSYGPAENARLAGEGAAVTSNGVVYGVVRARTDLFCQARFVWRRQGSGPRPMAADIFTTGLPPALAAARSVLEWCELDVACAGNSFWVRDGAALRRLPPQWCSIVLGTDFDVADPSLAWDARPVGLVFHPPGAPASEAETWLWSEVAHYAPERDPEARFRGMSYLRPAMEDIASDQGARSYLTAFWRNHATPNSIVSFPPETAMATIKAYRDLFLERHEGASNAWRTAFLGGGADVRVVGSSLKDLDTGAVRQQVHRDIAIAAGVNPVAAGLVEGNYAGSRNDYRAFADRKVRTLWHAVAEAFAPLFPAPAGAELWIDVTGVSALQADALDDANVMAASAQTMRTLIDGGYSPDSVTSAVTTGDLSRLVHTGLTSVQLVAPGADSMPAHDLMKGNDG